MEANGLEGLGHRRGPLLPDDPPDRFITDR